MSLPVVSTPTFTTKIPSTGQDIEYRPFLVKEEKNLLIALEGRDNKEIANSVLRLLKDCIITEIDTNTLATFDVEYLFLKLRGKSVGEVISINIGHTSEDSVCNEKTEININIDDIKVQGKVKDKKVMLNDNLGLVLNYPSISSIESDMNNAEAIFKFIAQHIDYVFDSETVYNDFTKSEIEDWMETLNQAQFQKIAQWYEGLPSLKHDVEWTCTKCGEKDKVTLEGLQNFF